MAITSLESTKMRIKNEKEAFIRIDYFPYDHAKKAYQDGYFI